MQHHYLIDHAYNVFNKSICIWRNLLHFFRPFKVCCKSFVGIVYLSGTISDHLYIGVFFIKSSYEKLTSFCQEHDINGDVLLLYT